MSKKKICKNFDFLIYFLFFVDFYWKLIFCKKIKIFIKNHEKMKKFIKKNQKFWKIFVFLIIFGKKNRFKLKTYTDCPKWAKMTHFWTFSDGPWGGLRRCQKPPRYRLKSGEIDVFKIFSFSGQNGKSSSPTSIGGGLGSQERSEKWPPETPQDPSRRPPLGGARTLCSKSSFFDQKSMIFNKNFEFLLKFFKIHEILKIFNKKSKIFDKKSSFFVKKYDFCSFLVKFRTKCKFNKKRLSEDKIGNFAHDSR